MRAFANEDNSENKTKRFGDCGWKRDGVAIIVVVDA